MIRFLGISTYQYKDIDKVMCYFVEDCEDFGYRPVTVLRNIKIGDQWALTESRTGCYVFDLNKPDQLRCWERISSVLDNLDALDPVQLVLSGVRLTDVISCDKKS